MKIMRKKGRVDDQGLVTSSVGATAADSSAPDSVSH